MMICRIYSFQERTQFSQGNNVLDAEAPNIDVILWRDTCVSSTKLNRPIWSKERVPPLENDDLLKVFFQNLTQFSQGNNVLDAPASNINSFLSGDICIS
jgi:hypothetical protein